jgi:hypothetical protein
MFDKDVPSSDRLIYPLGNIKCSKARAGINNFLKEAKEPMFSGFDVAGKIY